MRNALIGLLSAFFLSLPGLALANAGYIHDMKGQTTLTSAAGATTPARIGSIVPAGSTVRTAAGSSAVVKFEDGQVMALHENTAFRISEYNYNKTNVSQSRAVFNLLQGGMRFITGVIGSTNNNAVRLTAGTATIGIRGTDGILAIDLAGIVTAAVNAGAVALITPLGTQSIGPGNASSAGPNTPPSAPAPAAQAAPVVAAVIATLAAATNIPINTPVVVAASANAAAAQAAANADPSNAALQQAAATALNTAVQAAQQALATALSAGAVAPAPAAPPAPPPSTPQPGDGATSPTGTTSTPTGGAGAGGGGSTASPN